MYYALDEKRKRIVDQNGVEFTPDQFEVVLEHAERFRKPVDMTLMLQRFLRMGMDFEALEKFYNDND